MKQILLLALSVALCTHGFAQDTITNKKQIYNDRAATNPNFPFIVSLTTLEYDITVNLNDQKVRDKYEPIFKEHGVPFTADEWEDIIVGLIQTKYPAFAQQITTSAQDGVLRIGTGTDEYQKEFIYFVVPIFKDTKELEKFL